MYVRVRVRHAQSASMRATLSQVLALEAEALGMQGKAMQSEATRARAVALSQKFQVCGPPIS